MNNIRNYTLGTIGVILIVAIIYMASPADAATTARVAQACANDPIRDWLINLLGWWVALILFVVMLFRLASSKDPGAGALARKRIDNLCRQNERLRQRLDAWEKNAWEKRT